MSGLGFAIAAALAGTTPVVLSDDGTTTGVQAVTIFELAGSAEARGDVATAENAYRALIQDPDPEIRTEARFRYAKLLAAEAHFTDAAVLLRQILDEKPNAAPVRLELARMLAQMGDMRAAGRELRTAQTAGLPEDVALVVNQFALALRSLRPYGGSIEIGIAPDSNINRATRSETLDTIIAPFELSDDARAKSGVGLQVGAQAYLRQSIGSQVSAQARLSSRSNFYRDKSFRDVLGSAELGLEIHFGRNKVSPTIGRNLRWYGGEHYSTTDSASVNWQRTIGRTSLLEAEVSTGRADYKFNPLQDGWVHGLTLAYERSLSPTFGARVSLSGQRQTAKDAAYATRSGGGSLLAWKQFGAFNTFASVSAQRLKADERIFLYPDVRKEWWLSASVGATLRQITWKGFSPLVRVTYERNNSSLTLYDYDRLGATFGITRTF